jgi:hypothetical protein
MSAENSGCLRPIEVKPGLFVRCGSRVKSKCPPCAELYRGDWAAIARSGVFDGPVQFFQFYLLTLTAPSFGRVHRVPKSADRAAPMCACGARHTVGEAELRGIPLDPRTYDYAGQVAWNRDSGVLWDRTRRRIRDRWDSAEYFVVREWQARGVLHVHALVRIARVESPTADELGEAARTAVAASNVDGTVVGWGSESKCDAFSADGNGAKTIWYLSKALNYVMKDTAREGLGGRTAAWSHLAELERAARAMRCSTECDPANCVKRVHAQHGARSHVVSASRRTSLRIGWSFTGLTRTVQRHLRRAWMEALQDKEEAAEASEAAWARASLSSRASVYQRQLENTRRAVP